MADWLEGKTGRRWRRRFFWSLVLITALLGAGSAGTVVFLERSGAIEDWTALFAPPKDSEAARTLEALEARLSRLEGEARERWEAYPAPQEIALSAELRRLETGVRRDMAALSRRVVTRAESASAAALANYLALEREARSGRPFMRALRSLRILREGDADLEALSRYAQNPPPTLETLRKDFSAALEDYLARERRLENPGLWGEILARAGRVVSLRRVGLWSGEDSDAVLARMEYALEAGDLALAVREGEALRGGEGSLRDWMERAEARLQIERRLKALSDGIMAEIAASAQRERAQMER